MFNKQGDSRPLDLIHTCCLCEMAALKQIDGKYYCGRHSAVSQEAEQKKDDAIDLAQQNAGSTAPSPLPEPKEDE
jgi:hypothetical protein